MSAYREPRRALKGTVRDFGVLVIGVLVALSADALWEDREESALARAYLTALSEDMAEAATTLEGAIRGDSVTVVTLEHALALLRSSAPPDTTSSFSLPREYAPAVLPTGMLDALIATGDINLVGSSELRVQIVRLSALLDASQASIANLESQGRSNGTTIGFHLAKALSQDRDLPGIVGALRGEFAFISAVNIVTLTFRDRISLHRELLGALERFHSFLEAEVQ